MQASETAVVEAFEYTCHRRLEIKQLNLNGWRDSLRSVCSDNISLTNMNTIKLNFCCGLVSRHLREYFCPVRSMHGEFISRNVLNSTPCTWTWSPCNVPTDGNCSGVHLAKHGWLHVGTWHWSLSKRILPPCWNTEAPTDLHNREKQVCSKACANRGWRCVSFLSFSGKNKIFCRTRNRATRSKQFLTNLI